MTQNLESGRVAKWSKVSVNLRNYSEQNTSTAALWVQVLFFSDHEQNN